MTLVPFRATIAKQAYDPFRSIRGEFDRLFDDLFTQLPDKPSRSNALADVRIEVSETGKEVRLRAELPGVDEKDIDVQLTRDTLTLRGEKRFEKEEKDRDYHLVESSYGSFARAIRLPFEATSQDVSASFKNGLLTVTVRKPEKKEQVQKIQVKAE